MERNLWIKTLLISYKKKLIKLIIVFFSKGAAFAEKFIRTIRNPPKKFVFRKSDANLIYDFYSVTNQGINFELSPTKLLAT